MACTKIHGEGQIEEEPLRGAGKDDAWAEKTLGTRAPVPGIQVYI